MKYPRYKHAIQYGGGARSWLFKNKYQTRYNVKTKWKHWAKQYKRYRSK